nr:Chain B, ALA-ARG-ASP-CYS-PRO-LEU-VAL-ASN-PRO-LEU-CYS-LEU-HIS-PRO-GLY-TRP-THR-CYS [synthetic construct]
ARDCPLVNPLCLHPGWTC